MLASITFLASLDIFKTVPQEDLWSKQSRLVSYMSFVIESVAATAPFDILILTPEYRGSQLSVYFHEHGRAIFDYLMSQGVVTDWREPNVMRFAPVPLYNSFKDIYTLGERLKEGITKAILA